MAIKIKSKTACVTINGTPYEITLFYLTVFNDGDYELYILEDNPDITDHPILIYKTYVHNEQMVGVHVDTELKKKMNELIRNQIEIVEGDD